MTMLFCIAESEIKVIHRPTYIQTAGHIVNVGNRNACVCFRNVMSWSVEIVVAIT